MLHDQFMDKEDHEPRQWTGFRERCRRVIFHSTRPAERIFDVVLILAILASVIVVMLESIDSINEQHGQTLRVLEWCFTVAFTIEYLLRLYVSLSAARYARSFYGIVDLLAILPSYLDLLFPGAHYLMSLRALRLLRVFRVLKMVQFVGEAHLLVRAVKGSIRKITVFIVAVVSLVLILGSAMYLIEGAENGFTSVPKSVYWAIVTLTTVGYGDISPQTPLGQMLASVIMIIGYGIIAVPTGIVTAELTLATQRDRENRSCPECATSGIGSDDRYCHSCGYELPKPGMEEKDE